MVQRRTYLGILVSGATGLLPGTAYGHALSERSAEAIHAAQDTAPSKQAKSTAGNIQAVGDFFGWSVAVNAAGDTALVGAENDQDPNGRSAGSAYVFTRRDGAWDQQTKLLPNDGDAGDGFGWSVAVNAAGDTTLIGAYNDEDPNGQGAGSAYVFGRTDGTWDQRAKLTPDDGDEGDHFGGAVAVNAAGDTVLIGASSDGESNGEIAGSAYVFERTDGTWDQQAKLLPDDGDDDDRFGGAVAVNDAGDTVLVGADNDEDPNGTDAGSAYVFARTDGTWDQQAKLTPSDGDDGDFFGWSAAMNAAGDTALVGAWRDEDPNGQSAGSAYAFRRTDGTWSQQAKLLPDDGDDEGSFFGVSVAVNDAGDTVLVGASSDDNPNGGRAGSAYVFARTDGTWDQRAKLTPNDGDDNDFFGGAVAVNAADDTALIGAYNDEDPNGGSAGSAYVFGRTDGTWAQQAKLAAGYVKNAQPTQPTGRVVDLEGNGVDGATVFAIDPPVTDEPFRRTFANYQDDEDRPDLSPATTTTETRDGTPGQFRFDAADLPSTPVYLARWTGADGETWFSSVSETPNELQLTNELLFGPELATVDEWEGGNNSYDEYGGVLSVWREIDPAEPARQTFAMALTQAMFGLVTAPVTPTRAINPWEISLDRNEGQYNDWRLNSQPLYPGQAVFSLIVPEEVDDDDLTVDYENVRVAEIASKMLAEGSDIHRERLAAWHPTRTPHLPASVAPAVTDGYTSVSPTTVQRRIKERRQLAESFWAGFSLITGAIPYIGGAVSFVGDLTNFLDAVSGSDDVSVAAKLGSEVDTDLEIDPNLQDAVEHRYQMEPYRPTASVVYRVPVTFPDTDGTADFTAECTWAAVDRDATSVEPSYLCLFREQFTTGGAPQVGKSDGEKSDSPPDVTGDNNRAQDLDNDGTYEDVNGDGEATPGDATVLFNGVFENDPAVTNNVALFDFSGDGSLTAGDATVLFDEVF